MLIWPRDNKKKEKKKKSITKYEIGKTIITFGNIEFEKHKFHQYKNPISIYVVNIGRKVVSKKVPFGKKGFEYLIGYENDCEEVMPLCVILPKMSVYRRDFDETKY